ncbi:hypothetical protein ACWC0A_18015 [Streptomyces scopuliridis]
MTDPTIPLDDPRVTRLARERQQLAHEAMSHPTWDDLTDEERRDSLAPARSYLEAAERAGLLTDYRYVIETRASGEWAAVQHGTESLTEETYADDAMVILASQVRDVVAPLPGPGPWRITLTRGRHPLAPLATVTDEEMTAHDDRTAHDVIGRYLDHWQAECDGTTVASYATAGRTAWDDRREISGTTATATIYWTHAHVGRSATAALKRWLYLRGPWAATPKTDDLLAT